MDRTVENVDLSFVSMAVDYLTRWCLDHQKPPHMPAAEYAFNISCSGASKLDRQLGTDYATRATESCRLIDESRDFNPDAPTLPTPAAIAAAVELTSFDVAFRAGLQGYNPDANTTPDATTIQHIATMMERSLGFFRQFGPALVDGFTMFGGYTETVDSGDGDFVTADTLWGFKVSVKPPTSAHTLQLLVYWLMARHSVWNRTATWNWDHTTQEAEWRETWDLDAYLRENRAWPDDLHGPVPTDIGMYSPRLDVDGVPADVITAEREVSVYK
ncbi:MAG TPA: hypothetical protein VHZ98_10410 [Galbitalea sp.]|nr:hypothetical protein [Galbitalea sp.]